MLSSPFSCPACHNAYFVSQEQYRPSPDLEEEQSRQRPLMRHPHVLPCGCNLCTVCIDTQLSSREQQTTTQHQHLHCAANHELPLISVAEFSAAAAAAAATTHSNSTTHSTADTISPNFPRNTLLEHLCVLYTKFEFATFLSAAEEILSHNSNINNSHHQHHQHGGGGGGGGGDATTTATTTSEEAQIALHRDQRHQDERAGFAVLRALGAEAIANPLGFHHVAGELTTVAATHQLQQEDFCQLFREAAERIQRESDAQAAESCLHHHHHHHNNRNKNLQKLYTLAICDRDHHRVVVARSNGIFLHQFGTGDGSAGSGKLELNAPVAVDSAPGGVVAIADSGNNRIAIFQRNGVLIKHVDCSSLLLPQQQQQQQQQQHENDETSLKIATCCFIRHNDFNHIAVVLTSREDCGGQQEQQQQNNNNNNQNNHNVKVYLCCIDWRNSSSSSSSSSSRVIKSVRLPSSPVHGITSIPHTEIVFVAQGGHVDCVDLSVDDQEDNDNTRTSQKSKQQESISWQDFPGITGPIAGVASPAFLDLTNAAYQSKFKIKILGVCDPVDKSIKIVYASPPRAGGGVGGGGGVGVGGVGGETNFISASETHIEMDVSEMQQTNNQTEVSTSSSSGGSSSSFFTVQPHLAKRISTVVESRDFDSAGRYVVESNACDLCFLGFADDTENLDRALIKKHQNRNQNTTNNSHHTQTHTENQHQHSQQGQRQRENEQEEEEAEEEEAHLSPLSLSSGLEVAVCDQGAHRISIFRLCDGQFLRALEGGSGGGGGGHSSSSAAGGGASSASMNNNNNNNYYHSNVEHSRRLPLKAVAVCQVLP